VSATIEQTPVEHASALRMLRSRHAQPDMSSSDDLQSMSLVERLGAYRLSSAIIVKIRDSSTLNQSILNDEARNQARRLEHRRRSSGAIFFLPADAER
jgi:hypothetical protein